jgi:hypothetical protein
MSFVTRILNDEPDAIAPDGSEVRILAATSRGSMAYFELPEDTASKAVAHRTVEEVWFFTAGEGSFWRKNETLEETVKVFRYRFPLAPISSSAAKATNRWKPLV